MLDGFLLATAIDVGALVVFIWFQSINLVSMFGEEAVVTRNAIWVVEAHACGKLAYV